MYHLSQRLQRRGHKVIIITHSYGSRVGVRYLTSCVKVYYIPSWLIANQVILPTIYTFFPLFRSIMIRENIDIVHGHQSFSPLCHEAILHARTMGLKVVFTDHSLNGFQDTASILTNKLLKFTLSDIDHVICVSHTSKENTVLRASLDPWDVSVIPNAIISTQFTPDPTQRHPRKVTIVVASRLVYRKGIDLLVTVIPNICEKYPDVDFLIAGDGPKRIDLEQMREYHVLQDRVTLLGALRQTEIRDVLVKGHIFLNTSLTEAFCIAIVEAASCGLLVVSTEVGGIPEVLPEHMIFLAQSNTDAIVQSIDRAIEKVKHGRINPFEIHNQVANMYSWDDVAERTEVIYKDIMKKSEISLIERLERYHGCGIFAGKLGVMIMTVHYLFYLLLEWLIPRDSIDAAPAFDRDMFWDYCVNMKGYKE
ncbi:hypothetical protein BC833DRAFT_599876 [Globomyces pollinis-pini]|nr:hypothetical protein BC833DRAFT_599876 [Globomyces pollinis-pini]